MYHHSISYQVAQERQRDMLAEGQRERRARQSRPTATPQAPRGRDNRRVWQLGHQLRPQAQS
jgi:hypothetical protein